LQAALDWGFAEPDPERLRRTRALLVMQDGKLVAERYAPGFGPDTPLAGWSMAKTALNALVGVLVGQGELHLEAPVHVPEWQGDARSHITLDQLLRMSSGLEFSEEYGDLLQDVTVMLLLQPSAAAFAAAKPLVYPPGSHWYYASGTSNILSRLIRTSVGEDRYRRLSRDALFGPLGMDSAVLELDATGDYVASSFMYATARDWAKLGQLLVQDGVWQGRRMLPAGWVRYSTTPVPADLNGEYGAHLWLKIPESLRGPDPVPLPPDSFHAIGFESQFVTVVPSRRAVLVRLGLTRQPGAWRQDRWVQRVLDALPK
jgi:CubicO group peptidase (beta-lactamase class C family)